MQVVLCQDITTDLVHQRLSVIQPLLLYCCAINLG